MPSERIDTGPEIQAAQRLALSALGLSLLRDHYVPDTANETAIERALARKAKPRNPLPAAKCAKNQKQGRNPAARSFPRAATLKDAWLGKFRLQPSTATAIGKLVAVPLSVDHMLRIEEVRCDEIEDGDYLTPLARGIYCVAHAQKRKREKPVHDKQKATIDLTATLWKRFDPSDHGNLKLPALKLDGFKEFAKAGLKKVIRNQEERQKCLAAMYAQLSEVTLQVDDTFEEWHHASGGKDPESLVRCLIQMSFDPKLNLASSPALLRWGISLATALLCAQANIQIGTISRCKGVKRRRVRAMTTLTHLLWDGGSFVNVRAIALAFRSFNLEPGLDSAQRILRSFATLRSASALFRRFISVLGLDPRTVWAAWQSGRKAHPNVQWPNLGAPQASHGREGKARLVCDESPVSNRVFRRSLKLLQRRGLRQCASAVRRDPDGFVTSRATLKRERKAIEHLAEEFVIRADKDQSGGEDLLVWLGEELEKCCPSLLASFREVLEVNALAGNHLSQAKRNLVNVPVRQDPAFRSDSLREGACTASPSAPTCDRSPPISPSQPNQIPTAG